MSTKNDPAFPTLLTGKWAGTGTSATFAPDMTDGLSKLEWFAGQLLKGQAAFEGMEGCDADHWIEMAYFIAEKALTEVEKRK